MAQSVAVPGIEMINRNMKGIKHKILVLSGKGGVGKSTVAFSLTSYLASMGARVGLLDVDIHGPSIPNLAGNGSKSGAMTAERIEPVKFNENIKIMSIGYLLQSEDDAVVWRGPLKFKMISTFLQDVEWGELDYLVIDLPPGTGDESLSICQMIGENAGAVIVTTPQQMAISDVKKAVTFCGLLEMPIIGIIENMSGFTCPKCGEIVNIFQKGGGKKLAEDTKTPYLGEIPIVPGIVDASEQGGIYEFLRENSPFSPAFEKIMNHMTK